jgi:hypothetical protein
VHAIDTEIERSCRHTATAHDIIENSGRDFVIEVAGAYEESIELTRGRLETSQLPAHSGNLRMWKESLEHDARKDKCACHRGGIDESRKRFRINEAGLSRLHAAAAVPLGL